MSNSGPKELLSVTRSRQSRERESSIPGRENLCEDPGEEEGPEGAQHAEEVCFASVEVTRIAGQ